MFKKLCYRDLVERLFVVEHLEHVIGVFEDGLPGQVALLVFHIGEHVDHSRVGSGSLGGSLIFILIEYSSRINENIVQNIGSVEWAEKLL